MTSTTPMTRTAIFHARPGHGRPLAERLLHAASLVAEAPGCELWLVHRELEAGPQGLEVLAFGSHSPGDGEMVADRQRA